MPCVASFVRRRPKGAPVHSREPYGGGYLLEPHRYATTPDLYQGVHLRRLNTTAYFVDYWAFIQHRQQALDSRSKRYLPRTTMWINVLVRVNGGYKVDRTMKFYESDTVEYLVETVIQQEHGVANDNIASFPHQEGFAFDLLHNGRSLIREVNDGNRAGNKKLLSEFFPVRGGYHDITWKEYDDKGREWENPAYQVEEGSMVFEEESEGLEGSEGSNRSLGGILDEESSDEGEGGRVFYENHNECDDGEYVEERRESSRKRQQARTAWEPPPAVGTVGGIEAFDLTGD
ncbi:hypothetical protein ABW20_dc0104892 [Dactylellina cionopaga]|nr:hypothetical protein ABW20_dc0104892 [Dactylellina cionopaga]